MARDFINRYNPVEIIFSSIELAGGKYCTLDGKKEVTAPTYSRYFDTIGAIRHLPKEELAYIVTRLCELEKMRDDIYTIIFKSRNKLTT